MSERWTDGALPVTLTLTAVAAVAGCSHHAAGGVADSGRDVPGSADAALDTRGDLDVPSTDGDAGEADTGFADAPDVADGAGCDPREGALTVVVSDVAYLTERLCDLDGDGVGDNAFADRGSSDGPSLAASYTSIGRGFIGAGHRRVVHFPLVDDAATPDDGEATLIMFYGTDEDSPVDEADDFSGYEPFRVGGNSIDECGEPLYWAPASISGGVLVSEGGAVPLPLVDGAGRNAHVSGSISPCGTSAELTICCVVVAREIGDVPAHESFGGLSVLEVFLDGLEPLGLHGSGFTVDVDLDGDGIERFELDDDGQITACIDGDNTVTAGRDCWDDDRMADGFAMSMRLTLVRALFAGRPEGWEDVASSACEEWPLESSLFDAR